MTHDPSPRFGEADLSNCERELIHLAGSVMPHGVLLVVDESDHRVTVCSANTPSLLFEHPDRVLGRPIDELLPSLDLSEAHVLEVGAMPTPVRVAGGPSTDAGLLALIHRIDDRHLSVELEDLGRPEALDHPDLADQLPLVLETLSATADIKELADELTRSFKALSGYDRVMLYRFDSEGHGEVVGEAREPRLESFLGLRYPSTDIPRRARDLYMRNRVRMLVDVDYAPVPLLPPEVRSELDMSQCVLRSMSPIHLQYLRNMGVTGTLVASIIHDGMLWGLIACHHYSTKYVPYDLRATADLLAETAATRIAVLESYKRAEAEVKVRQLEAALIEEVQTSGDWKDVLVHRSGHLMRPVGAQGAALVHAGETLTVGLAPSRADLERLVTWLDDRVDQEFFHTSSLAVAAPDLPDPPIAEAAGVVAFRLSRFHGEYVIWFRGEQPRSVRWAGEPSRAKEIGSDPADLSPRRSFAVWNQLVRGTAVRWEPEDLSAAHAIGHSLRDISGQTKAMTYLLTNRQREEARENVVFSGVPLILADAGRRILLASKAFIDLFNGTARKVERLDDIFALLEEDGSASGALLPEHLVAGWRGTARLVTADNERTPVAVRIDPIPLPGGRTLGFIVIVTDLTPQVQIAASRLRLNAALGDIAAGGSGPSAAPSAPNADRLIGSILTNASIAALEIGDPSLTSLGSGEALKELEAATERTVRIGRLISEFGPREQAGSKPGSMNSRPSE
jgi:two-component system, chemotaxis family, sensor kinase Cph1